MLERLPLVYWSCTHSLVSWKFSILMYGGYYYGLVVSSFVKFGFCSSFTLEEVKMALNTSERIVLPTPGNLPNLSVRQQNEVVT